VETKLRAEKEAVFNSAEPLEQITAFEEYVKNIERNEY
jgi:hypothetical protein